MTPNEALRDLDRLIVEYLTKLIANVKREIAEEKAQAAAQSRDVKTKTEEQ